MIGFRIFSERKLANGTVIENAQKCVCAFASLGFAQVYIYIFIYILCIYVYTCIYAYIHRHTHTTHIHTYMLCIFSINIYETPLHKILHLIISSHHCASLSTPAKPKTNLGVTVRDHIRHMAWRGCQPSHSSNILWGRGRAKYISPYWQDQIYHSLLAGPNMLFLIGRTKYITSYWQGHGDVLCCAFTCAVDISMFSG